MPTRSDTVFAPLRLHRVLTLAAAFGLSLLAGCGTTPKVTPKDPDQDTPVRTERDRAPTRIPADLASIPDAVPRYEPPSRYGNPASYKVFGRTYRTGTTCNGFTQAGIASWYGTKFHGRRTSSGEPYDMYAMTAAHKTLPLPSYVRVTRQDNGKSIVVRVNDRGPFHEGRIIDLSYAAATKLGVAQQGTAPVTIECLPMEQEETTTVAEAEPVDASAEETHYLQLGVFQERAYAEALRDQLARHEDLPPVRIHSAPADGTMQHRVVLGPVGDLLEAEQLTDRLLSRGFERPYYIAGNIEE